MSQLEIEAQICEVDGTYYPVKLHSVPHVGELIDLFSYIDQAKRHPSPAKHYEVVKVVHSVHDFSDKIPQSMNGQHLVKVFVQPAQSQFFT